VIQHYHQSLLEPATSVFKKIEKVHFDVQKVTVLDELDPHLSDNTGDKH